MRRIAGLGAAFVYSSCMAFKTITIDTEAYELLRSRKRAGQSFSAVIKSEIRRGGTGRDLRDALARAALESSTLERLDRIVAARDASPARKPAL